MRKKTIVRLSIGDRMIKGKQGIIREVRNHFKNHFQKPDTPDITLPLDSFKMIYQSRKVILEEIPDDVEIIAALKIYDLGKSQGYEGFNIRFIMTN